MTLIHRTLAACVAAGLLGLTGCAPSAPPQASTAPAETATSTAAPDAAPYAMDDYAKVRKFDAHVHANGPDPVFLQLAQADNFELLSINVDYPDFPTLDLQHTAALKLAKDDPQRFHWAATFSMKGFGTPDWLARTNKRLDDEVAEGAKAVKVWKNIGMVEKNAKGELIKLDDPGLSPVAEHIQALGIPLIAHQAEPYNCWLPLDKMTTDNDREYFSKHPDYYMYLHPEMPTHEDLMAARDRFVAAHPQLKFVGAHMASLEYDVDVLAKFLDTYPNATVDLAARMSQVQYQSLRDPAKVRDFFVRYQDRLMYGTDLTQAPDADPAAFKAEAHAYWASDWKYLATAESQRIDMLKADVPGLALPRAVIDKIYYTNAVREFDLKNQAAAK
ncbi:Amidohydrolase [Pseudoxanthomonas sp. GM95]|uniref:amidohydrolase family protein n=1 Tax=Pseudoxanthomonas sp. GM95 TaxID=1881043 RepID=UPI0008C6D238|nr:amidohydrolase family protein [Pseudoxanthomonas sp. GM95]SEM14565.1 Amidohydrolase [Pseudoxanthomonas sp. GM95]